MKLRNIFTALTAALALAFVGCQEEERFLDELQVSKSYVAIPIAGGQDEITVTATDKWEITNIPEWLTVTPTSGAAGETKVTFSAEAGTETLEAVLYIKIGEVQQLVNVIQMAEKVDTPITDCATVLAEANVGKVYKCKGTVTDLTNYGKYGCFYINDGTAQVYVYGSMNSAQFNPEVGDIITFEGPWTSYGNFDDVTILSLEKSLIKLEKVFPETALPLDGGVATALLTIKQGELEVVIPEDAAWLTAGEPSSLGGMTSVELTAAPNEGGARKATVTFKVNVDGKDYFAMTDVEQLGAIAEVSVADFLAAPVGTSLYKLTGVVKNIVNTTYGNFDLVDATGSVYVYGLTNAGVIGSNDKSFNTLGINEGDVVTIIGTRADFKGTAQVGGTAYLVSHVPATPSTITDFLAQAVAADKWYKLTGKVANIKSTEYGNFDLVDDNGGSVYVYGLTKAPVAKNDKSFASLGIKEGDTVTLVGTRADFKGTAQVGGPAYYISHTAAATEPETPPTGGSGKYVKVTAEQTDWSGKYLIVFGSNAHASLASGAKDLNVTTAVTIENNAIEATDALAAAVMTVTKSGDSYNMTFADGKYFGMQHNGCKLMDSAFALNFAYTADGVKISGYVTEKSATYILYANTSNGAYYRCYVDKNGQAGYALPTLYKYAE